MATAKALRKRIEIFSQTEKTMVGDEHEGEVLLGYIREKHYFGVKRRTEEKDMGKAGQTTQEPKENQGEGAVFNLGVEGLTKDMEDLLSLGLKFVPVQRVNKSKVEADIERLKVKLMWDVYWKWVAESPLEEGYQGEGADEEGEEEEELRKEREEERRKERKFEGKTEKTPGGLPAR